MDMTFSVPVFYREFFRTYGGRLEVPYETFKFHWKETLAPVAGCCYYALIHFSPLTAYAP